MRIRSSVVNCILEHARRDQPKECCGLLIGNPKLIEQAFPAGNLSIDPNRYFIDPVDHFDAIRSARFIGLKVIGAYHSHPNNTITPSVTDLKEASYQNFIYIIATPGVRSSPSEQFACYRFLKKEFEPVKFKIVS